CVTSSLLIESISRRRLPLHLLQGFRYKCGDVMNRIAAISESLIEREVGQRQARERRMQVVSAVNPDGAVKDIDAVPSQTPAQREKRRRRMSEHTGFAVIALVKIHVSCPHQRKRRAIARMFALFESGMNVKGKVVFVIERQLPEEFNLISRNCFRE